MTKHFATGALAVTLIATGAHAETVLLNYAGQDVEVENGSQNYDFFDLGPSQLDGQKVMLVDDEPMQVGPFRPDGRADMRITTSEAAEGDDVVSGFGFVEFMRQSNFPIAVEVQTLSVDSPMDDYMINYPIFQLPTVSQDIRFASLEDQLATFGAGGANGNVVDDSFNYDSSIASLYGGRGEDLLEEVGDSVILGFRIEVLLDDMYGYEQPQYIMAMPEYCYGAEAMYFEECIIDIQEPQPEVLATYFGFVEFTRGSVTPGILGVNNVIGAAAVVPNTVPLPASVLLLGAGLGGLSVMRRRKKA